ncbi:methylamine dehydrogenase accessory protein MauD [Planifilum fulgidum]|jgi:methylamine dehydrogenase accessory protein MauD|uniref:Methylamine dehydrogenase accessory protein MauD n=1 Tax=Planifilum fulgidum TaxID=201973 RepID=A0A1I2NPQ9_9BACL|nr:redoxin domain-containing protein [Planifilum fulgidum]MBO2497247.1 hypothetical protein [Bacillota bacterium]MBO2533557.1 hypothetical protein [Thermoactinomycetaceae bacterium]SFG05894.1 methylamine dehydrogenase accessory protein MauD [Planifilum fulgidum]
METFLLYSNILLWIVQLLVIFALVVLFRQFGEIYLNSADAISRDGIPIGDYIPEFVGEDFSTTRAVTHKDLEGRPTLLAFISPNCDACRDLIPEWNQCCLDHREKVNFVLMGVGDREKMEAFVREREIHGRIVWDRRDHFLRDFRVRVTPFAFILDEKGIVRGKGLCNGKEHIEELLGKLEDSLQTGDSQEGLR